MARNSPKEVVARRLAANSIVYLLREFNVVGCVFKQVAMVVGTIVGSSSYIQLPTHSTIFSFVTRIHVSCVSEREDHEVAGPGSVWLRFGG